ncbi:hypothetical protein [Hydrogenimonas sp.]
MALHIDELLKRNDEKALAQLAMQLPDGAVEQIVDTLRGDIDTSDETYESPLDIGEFVPDGKERVTYRAGDVLGFYIAFPMSEFYERIEPQFRHLQVEYNASHFVTRSVNVDIERAKNGLWQLYFNQKPIAAPVALETMPLILQENLIIAYYQARSYLMALHAAAVSVEGRTVVMPAASGSGKSTLAAAFAARGYGLFSDEIALVGHEGRVCPLPFSMNIKEGSWEVLASLYPALMHQPSHLRFDGQLVKFLSPVNLKQAEEEVGAIVFPKYEKDASCKVEELSACETLRRIKEAGYQLDEPLVVERFERILEHLLAKPSYALTYGSLDEAIMMVRELVVG